ncbi:MAG TPA: integrase arm-type DNA-binding domain-containing protein [Methylocella sp.]|nr:integrase arm-type DNA-binding domain-containing protein [Methylocella sp.]
MLTDLEVKRTKPDARIRKLSDGAGLQLWIQPNGSKLWRLAYRFSGKQKLLALGVYPRMGLKEAREAREGARRLLNAGRDPSQLRKLEKAGKAEASVNLFGAIAAELLEKKVKEGRADNTLTKFRWYVRLAAPALGQLPLDEITPADVLAVLRLIEARGRYETAARVRAIIGEIFRYAIATGRAGNDPTYALRGALIAPAARHRAALVKPEAFGGLLRAISAYEGAPETRLALELLALTFVRPGELRSALWAEFDLDVAAWSIPAAKMKMRRPHKVPLSRQAIATLKELHALTGRGAFLLPSVRSASRSMSENTLNAALRRMGFTKDEMTSHGFRAAASSILNESGLWNSDAIEAQLAHADADSIRRAYARAEYWDERVRMMSWWADKIDEMRGAV